MNHEAIVALAFVDENGDFGNAVGVVLDTERQMSTADRIALAAEYGYSETVFVENLDQPELRVYTAQEEITFAGHALLGAAAAISDVTNKEITTIRLREGEATVNRQGEVWWVSSALKTTPPWWLERLETQEQVTVDPPSPEWARTLIWAWTDEPAGRIRARTFAPEWGIPEDQANGSGAMRLAACLNRELQIVHGDGSVIYARLDSPGWASIGGRVALLPS